MALRKQSTFWCICFFCCIVSSCSETNTLNQGHRLKNGEFLVSTGRVFTLGFFTPQEEKTIGYFNPENTQNWYIGIWYTYDVVKRPVWIANRNKPISKKGGAIEIDSNGEFKILDTGSTRTLLKSNHGAFRRVAAVLIDTGNLLLQELNSNGSAGENILWQSFDYPTDTLLLEMRLGFSYKKGQSWSLSSWVSDKYPATGPFTLGLDPNNTSQLIMWRRGEIQWRSGIWHNGKFPNLKDYFYRFDYISNDDEKYFTLSAENNWDLSFPMYQIDWKGAILHFDGYSRSSDSSRYSLTSVVKCIGQGYHHLGCVKPNLIQCRSDSLFDSTRGYALSEGTEYENDTHILGAADCEDMCWRNCSCVAYASIYPNGTGCELWNNITQLREDGYTAHRMFLFIISYVGKV